MAEYDPEEPIHYFDCDRFNIYSYGTRMGDCDCSAQEDVKRALDAAEQRGREERPVPMSESEAYEAGMADGLAESEQEVEALREALRALLRSARHVGRTLPVPAGHSLWERMGKAQSLLKDGGD